jgi:hypothetical protein
MYAVEAIQMLGYVTDNRFLQPGFKFCQKFI